MTEISRLTETEILDNIEELQYDDEFVKLRNHFLVRATERLNTKLMRVLLDKGANPNINGWGNIESLLHNLAHKYGSERNLKGEKILEAAKLLLDYGADPNIAGCNNLAPIQVCHSIMADEFENLLISYGADIEGNIPV